MTKKEHQRSKIDYLLFGGGFASSTFIAFVVYRLFEGRILPIAIDSVLYAAIVVIYIKTLQLPRTNSTVHLTRIFSYITIIIAILFISFIAYFVATFRW